MSTPSWRSTHRQTNLFGDSDVAITRERMAVLVGQFFEQLTGVLFDNTDVDHYLNAGDDRPDVVAWSSGPGGSDLLIESKASTSGHLIDVDQLHTYQALCRRRSFPWTRPRLYYALWLYTPLHWTEAGSCSTLLSHLCGGVEALYLVPGRLMEAMVEARGPKTYESWRGSKRAAAGHYARLSRLQHHLLRWARPEALRTLCGLLDVSLKGWCITTTEVRTAVLDEWTVLPFPVISAANWPIRSSIRK